MNTVNTIYKELLRENGTEEDDIKDNYFFSADRRSERTYANLREA